MLVMLEVGLIAALWGIAHRQLTSTMRFLTQFGASGQAPGQTAPVAGNDSLKPLARALSLLETGDPPDGGSGVYTCNATLLVASGPAYFTITYLKAPGGSPASGETWSVSSTQQAPDPSQAATWDTMPPTFGN